MSTVTKGQVSWTRIFIGVFTCGLSLPFIGWRKSIGSSKVIRTAV